MKINMITVAHTALTEERAQSALVSAHDVKLIVFTHSADKRIADLAGSLNRHQNITVRDYRYNRGLAKTWNEGIMISEDADVTIIFNDDITFSPGDVDLIAGASINGTASEFIVVCAGWDKIHQARAMMHGLSCFAIQKAAIDTVGYFDENFWPAYFEDNDFWRRCTLAGLSHIVCTDTNVIHDRSWTTRNNAQLAAQNHKTFPGNRQYYLRKWGGGPHEEVFDVPFDDGQFDLCIPKERVTSPYGDHDRPMPRLTRLI